MIQGDLDIELGNHSSDNDENITQIHPLVLDLLLKKL